MKRAGLLSLLCMLFGTAPLLGQAAGAGRIMGIVTDATTARPLAGVNVTIAGTQTGTLTGNDGRFMLPAVSAGQQNVRASLIGYAPQTQGVTVVADQAVTVNFQLQTQAVALEGVVAIGYGTQQRRDVTGSVASVRAEEVKQIPTSNAVDAIKGRVPGVDIVSSGYAPGAGMTVRVRGQRSMRATNDPLYVVDGIPLAGGIGDINPSNIESIEVLKDASATAIYGSRGANGVVLITTRKGRAGETRITYETYAGVQNPLNRIPMMSGAEYAEYKREASRAVGRYTTDEALFSPVELESIRLGRSTDWQNEILQTGGQQSHNLNINGGGENTRFSLNATYFDQTGITRGQAYDRYSLGFNLDHTVGRLRVGMSSNGGRSTQNVGRNSGVWSEALQNNPLGVARDDNGRTIFLPTPDGLRSNPISDIENWKREDVRTRIFGSLYSQLDIMDGLNWRVNFGPDLTDVRRGEFRGAETNARRLSSADAWREEDQVLAYTLDNLLQFNRAFGVHRIDATALYSIQQERFERTRATVTGLPYEHQGFYNLGTAATINNVGSWLSKWALQSYMGRVNYALHDKYLLTLTGRMDGSSRLAPGNKYAFFPSVALGWQVGDETFVRDLDLFTTLKLRASYGRTGNTSIDPYQTQGALTRTVYSFGNQNAFGYRPGELSNPALEWEKTDQYNLGVDFGVLGGRVSGSVDVYRQNTFDLIMERQLPQTSGFTRILENIGETQNSGLEVALSTINVDGWRGIRWTTDISVAANRNQIVSLYGGYQDDVGNRWFIGQPISVHYDFVFDGIWQLGQETDAARYRQVPGQIRVRDLNGDGQINDADRMILGTSFPKWTGSFSNRLDWANFDLAVLMTARQNFMVYDNFATQFSPLTGRYNNMRVNYWTPTNASNEHPRPNVNSEFPVYGSSRAYTDASFIRLRNVTLGFTVPGSVMSRFGANAMRIYASAQEPFLFTNYVGFDPESGTGAGVPSYRTLLVGTSLTF